MMQLTSPALAPTSTSGFAPVTEPAPAPGSLRTQGVRFFLVGSAGTVLQLGLYAATATFIGPQVASIASWLVSTVVTNAAHRALTFGVRGAQRNRTDQLAAFLTCLVGLLITSLVLAELPDADGISGVIAILAVNTVVGAARFVGMRWWLSTSGQRFGSHVGSAVHAMSQSLHGHGPMSGLHH